MEFKTYLEIGSYFLTAGVAAYVANWVKNRSLNKRAGKLGFDGLAGIVEKATQKLKQEKEGERELVNYSGIITVVHPDEEEFTRLSQQISAGSTVTFEVDTIEDPKKIRVTDTTALKTVLLLIKPEFERVKYAPAKLKLGRRIDVRGYKNTDGTIDVKEYDTSIDAQAIKFLEAFAPHIYKNLSEEEQKRGKDLLAYLEGMKQEELGPVEHPDISEEILEKIVNGSQLNEDENKEWESYFDTFGGTTASLIEYTRKKYDITLPERNIRKLKEVILNKTQKPSAPLPPLIPPVPKPPEDTQARKRGKRKR